MAVDLAQQIAEHGEENVQVIQSDASPDQLSEELESLAGKTYDLDAEERLLLGEASTVSPSVLVGGSTGDPELDRELLALQRESGQGPQLDTYGPTEEVSPDEALAAMMAEMDSMGI